MALASVSGAEEAKPFTWAPPKVGKGMFTNDLGMLDSEREDYATNLASYATNRVIQAKASPTSLEEARRLLAVALHLSPRNRKALVTTFQLGKGVIPDAATGDYSPQVLARLLITRGQLLQKQGGDENSQLSRIFIELAAGMDPKNEDAVYASETQRLDKGPVDWVAVTDYKPKEKPAEGQTP
ncbi:hypothetical protein KBB96_11585 [Luteolibacter ambystomatis]|uniref:Uncharacterized protein n=1 Tax=Luteolibacter ambystomatis TaxID=2824561 RepID=A0A975IXW9_9BACT|nr:hypothetical protein [Luteolibacter ambystomatis]QUE49514.1 hypothetical protein KBB96_11585 [Luteolibacter ambystomatis]